MAIIYTPLSLSIVLHSFFQVNFKSSLATRTLRLLALYPGPRDANVPTVEGMIMSESTYEFSTA